MSIPLHRALQKLKRCLAIPPFRHENFQYFTFVINRPPEVMRLAVDTNENLVQMPAPVGIGLALNPSFSDLRREYRAEPIPPEPYRLVADINATLEQ